MRLFGGSIFWITSALKPVLMIIIIPVLALPIVRAGTPIMMAHAITSRLPVEIVDHIFSELDTARHTELYRLLLVNSHFHALSIRLLYRNLRPWTPPRTVRLLQSLVFSYLQDRPSRCPPPHNFVKSLLIHLGNITTLKALTTLIYRALRTLPQLKSLVLDLSAKDNGYAWVLPPDVPFQLETFTTTLQFVFLCSFAPRAI